MHDLRYDPADPADAHAPDLRERKALDLAELRTVPPPNLREPVYDTRTEQEKLIAELVRLVDAMQALMLRMDDGEYQIGRIIRYLRLPETFK